MRVIEKPDQIGEICRLAAARFQQDAAMYRQLAGMPPVEGYEGPLGEDAARLAAHYERQATEALDLAEVFDRALPFRVSPRPLT